MNSARLGTKVLRIDRPFRNHQPPRWICVAVAETTHAPNCTSLLGRRVGWGWCFWRRRRWQRLAAASVGSILCARLSFRGHETEGGCLCKTLDFYVHSWYYIMCVSGTHVRLQKTSKQPSPPQHQPCLVVGLEFSSGAVGWEMPTSAMMMMITATLGV